MGWGRSLGGLVDDTVSAAAGGIQKVYGQITGSKLARGAVADAHAFGAGVADRVGQSATIRAASEGASGVAESMMNSAAGQKVMAATEGVANMTNAALGKVQQGMLYHTPINNHVDQARYYQALVHTGMDSQTANAASQFAHKVDGAIPMRPSVAMNYRYRKANGEINKSLAARDGGIAAAAIGGVGLAGYGATSFFGDDD